jgi:hypothetical protein
MMFYSYLSHRDQLHRRYKRTRDIDDWRAFKNAQRTEVNLHKDNSRSLWKVINRCIPSVRIYIHFIPFSTRGRESLQCF